MIRRIIVGLGFVVLFAGVVLGAQDLERILQGVNEIASPGLTGGVCAFGPQAFVVADGGAAGGMRQPVIAAARSGKGCAVIFGHTDYFSAGTLAQGDTGALMANLVRWAAPAGGKSIRVGVGNHPDLVEFLRQKGFDAKAIAGDNWADFQVIFLSRALRDDADLAAVKRFIDAGGAVFMTNTGWGWLQLNPGKTLKNDLPANRLLAPMGLAWTAGTTSKDKGTAGFRVSKPIPAMLHAGAALDVLMNAGKGATAEAELSQAGQTIMEASRVLPEQSALAVRLKRFMNDNAAAAVPTLEKPLKAKDAVARVVLALQCAELNDLPPEKLKAHPAAEHFPGAVPADAKRVTKTIQVDLAIPRWHSTGLYAAPGEAITLSIPADAAKGRLSVRIGAHTDHTYHLASWRRVPEISRSWVLRQPVTKIASAFGGLIYIEVPGKSESGSVAVTIANAVDAPHYVRGKTPLDQWRSVIRKNPAPWAELESDKLILTLKADAVRKLDDPDKVMEHWDRVMDACATLAAWPIQRKSPERIANDADISAGYMHSGYPIMTMLDVTEAMVDLNKLRSVRSAWGFYHEIGHNHQNADWTFDGTGEVTVNLFTMYVLETVCGVSPEDAAGRAMKPAGRIEKYLANPDFEQWKRDPFLALAMYAQLRQAFGWEAYIKVFAEYRSLPADQRPRGDQEKHDQWMVRFSKMVGKNLGPFFQAWGVPTSESARKSIEDLPKWMPKS